MKSIKAGWATIVLLLLSACATTPQGLAESSLELTIISTAKTPLEFAECSIERMSGSTALRGSDTHPYILRFSGYQMPYARWDFRPGEDGGAVAELRKANISIGSGEGDVRACA